MTHESKVTTDHETIRLWAEERGGWPTTVIGTPEKGENAGLLRIDFPGYSGEEDLKKISWEEFFDKFDDSNLAFVYQDETQEGKTSRFGKFVDRDSVDQ